MAVMAGASCTEGLRLSGGGAPTRTRVTMGVGNSFGRLFRISTWGESHGGGVGVTLDGCPPRLPITTEEIQEELTRRRPGQSRLTTPRQGEQRRRVDGLGWWSAPAERPWARAADAAADAVADAPAVRARVSAAPLPATTSAAAANTAPAEIEK